MRAHAIAGRRAFTLVELLVAITVLLICLAMLSQIINMASLITGNSRNQMDSLEQGRFVLDRIGIDIDSRIRLNQVPVEFDKNSGNDVMTFYTQNGRDSNSRTAMLVSYKIINDPTTLQPQLQRASDDVSWTSSNPLPFLPQTLTLPTDYQLLSADVFRMEVIFLMKDTQTFTTSTPTSWTNVAAVVVALATLDSNSRKMVPQTQWPALVQHFTDAVNGSQVLPGWQTELQTLPQVLPLRAASAVRIYQRFYYVN